jgi:hypothetical protein
MQTNGARLGSLVLALLIGAALAPVLLVRIPAMVDYPNRLARMYLLSAAGSPAANPYYRVEWAIYPNLALDPIGTGFRRRGGHAGFSARQPDPDHRRRHPLCNRRIK